MRRYVDPRRQRSLDALLVHMDALENSVHFRRDLLTLVEMGRRAQGARVRQVVLGPPRFALFEGFEPGTSRGWVMIPDVPEIRSFARRLIGD